jgi:glycosyltransferase involved in cell wall biosynthesis
LQKSYFLYSPPMVLGGAEILFSRLADHYAELGFDVTIFDDQSGFYKKLTKSSRLKYEIIAAEESRKKLGEHSVLITTTLLIPHLSKFFDLSSVATVVYWSIHPCHLLRSLPIINAKLFRNLFLTRLVYKIFFPLEHLAIRNLLVDGLHKNSFVCMDVENKRVNEEVFKVNLPNPKYLPIPTTEAIPYHARPASNPNALRIGWLGRLCDFKSHGLIRILKDLNHLVQSGQNDIAEFIVAGDGPDRISIESFAKSLNFKCSFTGNIQPHDIETTFSRVDVAFAMGTSALDLGIRSIPVCLVDAAYAPIKDEYRYRWLFETKCFNLGSILDSTGISPLENEHSMSDIIKVTCDNSQNISRQTHEYVCNKHTLSKIAKDLEDIALQSRQRLSDLTILEAQKRGPFSLFMRVMRKIYCRQKLPFWLED